MQTRTSPVNQHAGTESVCAKLVCHLESKGIWLNFVQLLASLGYFINLCFTNLSFYLLLSIFLVGFIFKYLFLILSYICSL